MGQMLGTGENYIFFSLANIINIKVCLTGRFVNHFQLNNLKFIKTGLQLLVYPGQGVEEVVSLTSTGEGTYTPDPVAYREDTGQ